jgi:hypothetical protein
MTIDNAWQRVADFLEDLSAPHSRPASRPKGQDTPAGAGSYFESERQKDEPPQPEKTGGATFTLPAVKTIGGLQAAKVEKQEPSDKPSTGDKTLKVRRRYIIQMDEKFEKNLKNMEPTFSRLKNGQEISYEDATKLIKTTIKRYLVQNSTWNAETALSDPGLEAYKGNTKEGEGRGVKIGSKIHYGERVRFHGLNMPSMVFSPNYEAGTDAGFSQWWAGKHVTHSHYSGMRVSYKSFWLGPKADHVYVGIATLITFSDYMSYADFIGSDTGAAIISKLEDIADIAKDTIKGIIDGLLDW